MPSAERKKENGKRTHHNYFYNIRLKSN